MVAGTEDRNYSRYGLWDRLLFSKSLSYEKVDESVVLLVGGGIPEVASSVLFHPLVGFMFGLSE